MSLKPLSKQNIGTSFIFNLGVIVAITIILYIMFFVTLRCVTHQGQEVKIPNLKGKNVVDAINQLNSLHFEIVVDSTYETTEKPMTILKQIPDTGSVVKNGRTVFLTVNKVIPSPVSMPNLVSLSYRSAEMMLKNNKLLVGDTILKPDIAAGAVLEVLYKGSPIRAGELIMMGSKLTLVIGNGLGNTQLNVPNVVKTSVDEAITMLYANNIQPRIMPKDGTEITDTSSAYVICQYPKALNENGEPNLINMGDFIELIIVQNPEASDYESCNKNNTIEP